MLFVLFVNKPIPSSLSPLEYFVDVFKLRFKLRFKVRKPWHFYVSTLYNFTGMTDGVGGGRALNYNIFNFIAKIFIVYEAELVVFIGHTSNNLRLHKFFKF